MMRSSEKRVLTLAPSIWENMMRMELLIFREAFFNNLEIVFHGFMHKKNMDVHFSPGYALISFQRKFRDQLIVYEHFDRNYFY